MVAKVKRGQGRNAVARAPSQAVRGRGRRQLVAVETPPPPPALIDRLDFENAPPSVVLPALAFQLQQLAGSIHDLGDLCLQLDMSPNSASLSFRAYARKPTF